jgi:cytoskeletal protein CcmA (bactofilin family)
MWKRDAEGSNTPAITLSTSISENTKEWDIGSVKKKVSLFGPSIKLDGIISGEDDIMLQGRVKGRIELPNNTVTIGAEGFLEGDVVAQIVFVEGSVKGNIKAGERVVLHHTAQLVGNIACDKVSIEEGAKVNGSIDMAPHEVRSSDVKSESRVVDQEELETEEALSH